MNKDGRPVDQQYFSDSGMFAAAWGNNCYSRWFWSAYYKNERAKKRGDHNAVSEKPKQISLPGLNDQD